MADEKFYFNPSTREITQGKVSGWDDRMGPYDTREEAQRALETAAQRTKEADDQDRAEDDWGKPPAWEN